MKLLVVCLGNICRSPMGEGALRARIAAAGLAQTMQVDSAGTGGWHAGEPPDRRAIRCARAHQVDIAGLRARQVCSDDFAGFDWLLCADAGNRRDLLKIAPAQFQHKLVLWLPWAGLDAPAEIPDPYTGDAAAFEQVWQLVDDAAQRTLERIGAVRA